VEESGETVDVVLTLLGVGERGLVENYVSHSMWKGRGGKNRGGIGGGTFGRRVTPDAKGCGRCGKGGLTDRGVFDWFESALNHAGGESVWSLHLNAKEWGGDQGRMVLHLGR